MLKDADTTTAIEADVPSRPAAEPKASDVFANMGSASNVAADDDHTDDDNLTADDVFGSK